MRAWTVHAPAAPPRPASVPPAGATPLPEARPVAAPAAAPARLVREGFSWWAFLAPPVWLAAKGLWWPLLGWVAAFLTLGLLPGALPLWAWLALGLLTGFQARDLERWRLARRGLPERAVVMGHDEEEAILRLAAARPDLLGLGGGRARP